MFNYNYNYCLLKTVVKSCEISQGHKKNKQKSTHKNCISISYV